MSIKKANIINEVPIGVLKIRTYAIKFAVISAIKNLT